jgi:hypothetical protein
MAKRATLGFSLVELLVALVFTMILMAGMATVFKSSLTSFYTSGEKLSSMRRNRASTDLLYDDLNNAGMALVDLTSALPSNDTNPAFYIIPNVAVAGAGALDPQTTDELYMAYDQPLAFDGQLTSGGGAVSGDTAIDKVLNGTTMSAGTDDVYVINCGDPTYASSVKPGMYFQIKDDMSHAAFQIATAAPMSSGSSSVKVTVVSTITTTTQVTGRGDSGTLRPNKRIPDSGVVFILPSQMVRYRIALETLDPQNANGIPCLIREQGTYDPNSAFAATDTQIIAENVAGFKTYLSADSGADWAGQAVTGTGLTDGWTNGIQAALNTQLANIGRADYTTTAGNTSWYRDIPILVRIDLTTRTATQRAEYSATATTLAYKNLTQSLVLVPRHFGLTMK